MVLVFPRGRGRATTGGRADVQRPSIGNAAHVAARIVHDIERPGPVRSCAVKGREHESPPVQVQVQGRRPRSGVTGLEVPLTGEIVAGRRAAAASSNVKVMPVTPGRHRHPT